MKGLMLIVHNVGSAQRLVDLVKAAYSINKVSLVIITRPYGAAAQSGIPDANRIAFRRGKGFIVLPELRDAIELIKPNLVYTVSWDYGERVVPSKLNVVDGTAVVVGATEPGLTREEALLV